jgi:c-di-GMP-binding flagellar brake protein YcgR
MDERRASKRWRTTDYSRSGKRCPGKYFGVYNQTGDEFIGYLIDISSEGMMILSKRSFPEGEILKVRVELPEEAQGSDQLMVEARCVWCERDTNPEFMHVGFSFTYTFPHHTEVIELLFKKMEKTEDDKSDEVPSQVD